MSLHKENIVAVKDYQLPNKLIPIVHHYSSNSLLTQNGILLQTIKIESLLAKKIKDFKNLRNDILEFVNTDLKEERFNISIWLHTAREKADLFDKSVLDNANVFQQNMENLWYKSNHFTDKHVNSLYITFAYKPNNLSENNIINYLKNIFTNIQNSDDPHHNHYNEDKDQDLALNLDKLSQITDSFLNKLSRYNPSLLGIYYKNDIAYSSLLSFIHKLISFEDKEIIVPIEDLSNFLSRNNYEIFNNKIKIINKDDDKQNNDKYISILALKSNNQISQNAINDFLQIPVTMIVMEIIYFTQSNNHQEIYKEEKEILSNSKDKLLYHAKSLDMIDDAIKSNNLIKQQISCVIKGDNIDELNHNIKLISKKLSSMGIAHCKEDIDIEKNFFALIPGNLLFASRMQLNILYNMGLFSSIYGYEIGDKRDKYGNDNIVFENLKAAPYYFDLKDDNDLGDLSIFGVYASGKTILMNFIASHIAKQKSKILYFTTNNKSALTNKLNDGIWLIPDINNKIINPFIIFQKEEGREFILEFLQILIGKYDVRVNIKSNNLSEDNLEKQVNDRLVNIIDELFKLNPQDRNIDYILNSLSLKNDIDKLIHNKLKDFGSSGEFNKIFNVKNNDNINANDFISLDLQFFTDEYFTKNNYPKDQSLINLFEDNLSKMQSLRVALIYTMINHHILNKTTNEKNLIILHDVELLIPIDKYGALMDKMRKLVNQFDSSMMLSFDLQKIVDIYQNLDDKLAFDFLKNYNNKILLPTNMPMNIISEILSLSKQEYNHFIRLNTDKKEFLLLKNNLILLLKFHIKIPQIYKILSSDMDVIKLYQNILKEDKTNKKLDFNKLQLLWEKLG